MKRIPWVLTLFIFSCSSPIKNSDSVFQPSKKDFTFFVLGDWGMKGKFFQTPVANQMILKSKIYHPNFIATVGDNFYETGVQSVHDEHWKESYEDIYKELTKKYRWYVSLGNHDIRGNIQAEIDYNKVNGNWTMPDQYYTFVKRLPKNKSIRFVFLNTSPYATSYYTDEKYKNIVAKQDTAKQTFWVDSVLSHSKEDWKIVIGHHPLYSTANEKGQTENLRSVMQPIFDKYHVNAYISGHDHVMQFNQPKESGVAYIISGGGAKPGSKHQIESFTTFSASEPAFSIISIQKNQLTFNFIDTSGKILYRHSISK